MSHNVYAPVSKGADRQWKTLPKDVAERILEMTRQPANYNLQWTGENPQLNGPNFDDSESDDPDSSDEEEALHARVLDFIENGH